MRIHRNLRPVIQPYDGKRYAVKRKFSYRNSRYNIKLDIPYGFLFDGASIPRLTKSLVSGAFDPEYAGPALLHDALYRRHEDATGRPVSRKTADLMLLYDLKRNGVGWLRRHTIYRSVRLGGWVAW